MAMIHEKEGNEPVKQPTINIAGSRRQIVVQQEKKKKKKAPSDSCNRAAGT